MSALESFLVRIFLSWLLEKVSFWLISLSPSLSVPLSLSLSLSHTHTHTLSLLSLKLICTFLFAQAGGPFYPLHTGRRDSPVAYPDLATYELPSPLDDLSRTTDLFASRGFDERETVSLLGNLLEFSIYSFHVLTVDYAFLLPHLITFR